MYELFRDFHYICSKEARGLSPGIVASRPLPKWAPPSYVAEGGTESVREPPGFLKATNMEITKEKWGAAPDGKEIFRYTMKNASGAYVQLASIGAAVVSIVVPDREGRLGDVALGYPDAADYFGDGPCAGKIPGRFANRIAGGRFTLDGVTYTLPVNNGPNHLHGGPDGFQNRVWESRIEGDAVEFLYFSEDGEAGYPGNLKAIAHYEWSEDNELKLILTAQTDAPTVVNLTSHLYLNMDGDGSGSVLDNLLKLNASQYLPTDPSQIPLGEPADVAGTPMDFIEAKPIGADIKADFEALRIGKGYDHCWLIDGAMPAQLTSAAELRGPRSGRHVEIFTTQPAVQVYTGNWLKGCPNGKTGKAYEDYDAVAIECQHTPDAPNQSGFPSTVLRPGEVFEEAVIWAFDA